jgi:uncharacterized protein YdeI (BOF family)
MLPQKNAANKPTNIFIFMGDIMKKLTITVLTVLISFASLAQADIEVTGQKAKNISKALENAGAYFDCWTGHCGVMVSNLKCEMTGNSIGKRHYSCSFSFEDESNQIKDVTLTKQAAKTLFNAIAAAAESLKDCGMGQCSVEAEKVSTSNRNDGKDGTGFRATITPAND